MGYCHPRKSRETKREGVTVLTNACRFFQGKPLPPFGVGDTETLTVVVESRPTNHPLNIGFKPAATAQYTADSINVLTHFYTAAPANNQCGAAADIVPRVEWAVLAVRFSSRLSLA